MSMSKRMLSIQLMTSLQPFTQEGVISAVKAGEIVKKYQGGDISGVTELYYSGDIPMYMNNCLRRLEQFI